MPSRHHLFSKGNRSQVSLGNSEANDKRLYGDSPLHSPAFPPQSGSSPHYDDGEQGKQSYSVPYRSEEANFYQPTPAAQPTRSQSQRIPNINTNQPTIHLVAPHSSSSTPSSAIDDNPDRYYQQGPTPPSNKAEPKKRRFFGLGSSSSGKDSSKGGGNATTQKGLGRSISVRRKEQVDPQIYVDAGYRGAQQQWSKSSRPTEEEDEGGRAGLRTSNNQYTSDTPLRPDKDPLKSPAFPPPLTDEDYNSVKSQQQDAVAHSGNLHPLERQGSHQSSWERTAQQVQKHLRGDSTQQPTPAPYHPSPPSTTSTSSHPFSQRSIHEDFNQYYQDQNSRPPSQQSFEPPPVNQRPRTFDFYQSKKERNQASSGTYMQGSMGPPPPQQTSQNRRSSESAQQNQTASQARDAGVYQPYNQSVQQGSILPSNAPPQYNGQLAPQSQNYRGNNQSSPMSQANTEQGRNTPPPSRSRDDLSGLDVSQLLARHDELQDKYRRVKKYYFDKESQVQQLQNTLAHQRLAQSRTSLDDNEYANRFQRLDGAINNLAFNIRRDWRSIPPWLAPHVNRDAATQPTKEMTAVGRACISRWLVDELIERYFHPAIEPAFSAQLKIIEKNLRRFAAPTPSDEEKDALMVRISNWRLATLDGLHDALNSPQAAEYRSNLLKSLVENLTASLTMMLKDPPPIGLEGSVNMIMELAVGIAANLPLESRDVYVEYITPGALVQDNIMKIETGLPPLTAPGESLGPEGDSASMLSKQTEETGSIDSKETGTSAGNGNEDVAKQEATMQQQQQPQQQQQQQQQSAQGKKKSMFGGFINSAGSKKGGVGGGSTISQPPQQAQAQQQQGPPKEDRVRFSTFMAVEVRGKSVLYKAPVYVRE